MTESLVKNGGVCGDCVCLFVSVPVSILDGGSVALLQGFCEGDRLCGSSQNSACVGDPVNVLDKGSMVTCSEAYDGSCSSCYGRLLSAIESLES